MAEYHPGKVIKRYRMLKGWSQQKLADNWPKTDGETGVTWHYVQRVEYGKRNIVDQTVLRKMSTLLDIPLAEFGFSEHDPYSDASDPSGVEDQQEQLGEILARPDAIPTNAEPPGISEDGEENQKDSNLEVRSIMVVVSENLQGFLTYNLTHHLLTIAHTDYSTSHQMTAALRAAIEDAKAMNIDEPTRREALRMLASLPMTTLGTTSTLLSRHYDEMLRHCTAALEACWHLYRSSDPIGTQHAFGCVCTYVPLLERIAHDSDHCRKAALNLATHYAILQTLLGWNAIGAKESIIYAQKARDLSKETGDILLQLSAYCKLNYTCLLSKNFAGAWKAMLEGEYVLKEYQREKNRTPLSSGIIGNFYSSYSIAQVDNGINPDNALGIASDSEPLLENVAFMEFTQFDQWWEAARACNSKGDPKQAIRWLEKLIDLETFAPRPGVPQSEGGRITAINTLTYSLLQLENRDLEYIIKTWITGIEGAKERRAEERYRKAIANFEIMKVLYPGEQTIMQLVPLTEHWSRQSE